MIVNKIKDRIRAKTIAFSRNRKWYVKIYSSYWHYRFCTSKKQENHINYYSAIPNRGAGIGHQLANWIAGYWYAHQFGLQFAHTSFSSKKWERFLGFGEGETSVQELLHKGFKKVRLPLFNEINSAEVDINKGIIASYSNQRVVFVAEQDQFYQDQFAVMDELKRKFYGSIARQNDQLLYSNKNYNIAIHVRRGDIVAGQMNKNPNLLMRWQDNNYFLKVLSAVTNHIQTEKPIAIYLFSQGERNDFTDFEQFKNIHFCLDMGEQDAFLHMVYADLLITSKSSFSYKPALLSNGVKVCPKKFWHGYPNSKDWVLVNENGVLNIKELNAA